MRNYYEVALSKGKDLLDTLSGKRRGMVPPRQMWTWVGPLDFYLVGEEFLRYFIKYGGLNPTEKVLDVGSGIGQMAFELTSFLTTGTYEGFDTYLKGVEWCRRIESKYPTFHFQHADIYHPIYNPKGTIRGTDFEFPYKDRSFDFIFLKSIFTHLQAEEILHYLHESWRVATPSARLFATFFLGPTHPDKWAVAHEEGKIMELYNETGWSIKRPILYGTWSGKKGLSYQDIIIAVK
jgi:ubiquinone/menaquinone biosynthesis C-methylase UbiE